VVRSSFRSGWRNSAGERLGFTQSVNYPAASVNVAEGQSKMALIRGRVRGAPKAASREPYRLVVNGVAMPMPVEGDRFERPYLFGYGSNSVSVASPDGRKRSAVEFFEANKEGTQPRLSVVLSWDTDQTDLDLHVISPDGKHCYYGERVMPNGGALDVDVTTGFGPEIFSTPVPLKGTYLVYVNYYGSGGGSDLTVAQVSVLTQQNTPDEKQQSILIPMRQSGELTHAFTFVLP
jgi:uncharacterized protein YfaP (DUF2135 family)